MQENGDQFSDLSNLRKQDVISMLNAIVMSMCLETPSRSVSITRRAFEEAEQFTSKYPNAYIHFDVDSNGDIVLTLKESVWEK